MIRLRVLAVTLVVLVAAGAGIWLRAGAGGPATREQVVVDGVPLDVVHPAVSERRPGVVVAHGFAGSATLMAQFGDVLSARGYVVVLLDFAGHGANSRPLPDGSASSAASTAELQRDLDVAVTHLRGLSDVDPSRISLVGHSMGASAVTRYAVAHPEIAATVAISLPDASTVQSDLPARLLLLVGGLEFPSFRTEAKTAAGRGGADRSVVVVPGVEHISILYAPRTHRETADWLDQRAGDPLPSPIRRVSGAGLLLLALLIGLYPVARLLLGGVRSDWPRRKVPHFGRVVLVAGAATAVAAQIAPVLPTINLPLAVGNYVVGFTALAGLVILAYQRWRGPKTQAAAPAGRLRLVVATPLLLTYAGITIAVPMHLGLTNAVPVGARWWLLPVVWAGFAVLAHAAERITGGNSFGVLAVSAIAVIVLTGAALVALTASFVLLVVPLLAILLLWQAIWSAVLHRFAAPTWLIALVGSLIVAWPIATALPMIS